MVTSLLVCTLVLTSDAGARVIDHVVKVLSRLLASHINDPTGYTCNYVYRSDLALTILETSHHPHHGTKNNTTSTTVV